MEMVKTKVGTLDEILASRSRAVFSHRVNFEAVQYNHLDNMRLWCFENCQGIWRAETTHALYWQFDNDKDAFLFMLKWGSAEGNKLK